MVKHPSTTRYCDWLGRHGLLHIGYLPTNDASHPVYPAASPSFSPPSRFFSRQSTPSTLHTEPSPPALFELPTGTGVAGPVVLYCRRFCYGCATLVLVSVGGSDAGNGIIAWKGKGQTEGHGGHRPAFAPAARDMAVLCQVPSSTFDAYCASNTYP
ncbi:uncharacterized protein LY79DRAFT_544749 [Colletotrichum navitas]|uniref:Uncharacterized protein n=1 Tax=Colletotrichum navitas TaxID=681940 RepID=A0AAD8Q643_9PEZI|nr:uncharacterized protein LY79DRAFT_544749 [Colletotrichum navitas]KAK1596410.1 hypothetical protein LY79DRAFT_544749 [Colletotrichum navitas]